MTSPPLGFPDSWDDAFGVGEPGNRAFFGRDVLRGLTEGIREFRALEQDRWQHGGSLGPVLLGSAMWVDDAALIDELRSLQAACVVVTKQGRGDWDREKLRRLQAVNDATPGIPAAAFAELSGLAPRVDGEPTFLGPYVTTDPVRIPTVRVLGFRRTAGAYPPIVHAKLALLGQLWWHDEGAAGEVTDVIGFSPERLWISSANFTASSRRNLEFGFWTEDVSLMTGARRFLVNLMAASEGLDPDADLFEPELADVEYDDEAMRAAISALADDEAYADT